MDNNQQQLVERDYFLCQLSDLEELQSIELEIDERKLFAIRQDNQLYAYWNSCPHLSVALNWGHNHFLDPSKTHLQCATHGALFQISDGLCISGPCMDDQLDRVLLEQDQEHTYIVAGQRLPEPARNLRQEALDELNNPSAEVIT